MIRIRIELIPNGDESRMRTLARADVANITTGGCSPIADYSVFCWEGDNPPARRNPWDVFGNIFAHNRRQSVWELVAKVAKFASEEAGKQ